MKLPFSALTSLRLPLLARHRTAFKTNSANAWMIFLAIGIGALTGLVGGAFRLLLVELGDLRDVFFNNPKILGSYGLFAGIGIAALSIFIGLTAVRKLAKEAGGSGIQEIEGGLDGLRPFRWKRVIPVKFFASLFTIGPGLLLGREGPTVQLGANIGKMVKDIFRQPEQQNNPLVSTGAAAGLAAAFDAPLAGMLFVIEEMEGHFRFNFLSLSCVMLGSAVATIVVSMITHTRVVIPMAVYDMPSFESMWIFLIFGLCVGVLGLVFNTLLLFVLDLFARLNLPPIFLSFMLACIVVLIGSQHIEMVGADFGMIGQIFSGDNTITSLLILFGVRMMLGIICYGTGVPGGIFAPMIILGITFGMAFGIAVQEFLPGLHMLRPEIFALVGMGSFFSAAVRAPLTGVLLVVEMTSNYELVLPLVLAASAAAVLTSFLGNKPIYASLLGRTLAAAKEEKKKELLKKKRQSEGAEGEAMAE
ncbi:MAG: H(+)/Cl(-) exchange transporter ClcA [Desulforhopalus sp.]|nr:H(+)/Cl(-) exchange transporter ClcA [Desulforhopalus sp.]